MDFIYPFQVTLVAKDFQELSTHPEYSTCQQGSLVHKETMVLLVIQDHQASLVSLDVQVSIIYILIYINICLL